MEGDWRRRAPTTPLILFGMPEHGGAEQPIIEIAIPHLGSLILTHSWNGAIKA